MMRMTVKLVEIFSILVYCVWKFLEFVRCVIRKIIPYNTNLIDKWLWKTIFVVLSIFEQKGSYNNFFLLKNDYFFLSLLYQKKKKKWRIFNLWYTQNNILSLVCFVFYIMSFMSSIHIHALLIRNILDFNIFSFLSKATPANRVGTIRKTRTMRPKKSKWKCCW